MLNSYQLIYLLRLNRKLR